MLKGGGRRLAASSLPSFPFAVHFGGLRRAGVGGKLRLALTRNSAPKGDKGSGEGIRLDGAAGEGFGGGSLLLIIVVYLIIM